MEIPRFTGIIPASTPKVYQRRFEKYEAAFEGQLNREMSESEWRKGAPQVKWNAWVDVMRHALEVSDKGATDGGYFQQGRLEMVVLHQYGSVLETDQARKMPYQRVPHAFAAGFLQQQRILDDMYGGNMPFELTSDALADE